MDQIRMKWSPIPLPPQDTFLDQIALVTGGTSGLGLALAAHFINLGAAQVIITSRNAQRAEKALAELERITEGKSKGRIRVMELEMASLNSVMRFAEEIKQVRNGRGGVDCVVLNAGVIPVEYGVTEDKFEQALQVNALAAALLGLLLLDWMKSERPNRTSPAHMTLTGSTQHVDADVSQWEKWMKEAGGEGIIAHLSAHENWPGPTVTYANTKLLAHYVMAELADLAVDTKTGRPAVIVNTACPGVVVTDLARHHSESSRVMALAVTLFQGILGKSADEGARTLLRAVMTEEKQNGKFIRFYGSEEKYKKQAEKLFHSESGTRIRASVWSEMMVILKEKGLRTANFSL